MENEYYDEFTLKIDFENAMINKRFQLKSGYPDDVITTHLSNIQNDLIEIKKKYIELKINEIQSNRLLP